MTAAHDEMAGGCGGEGDGLLVLGPSTWMKAVSGSITARWQANACLLASGKSLTMSGDVIKPAKRSAMVVGENPYGKCRFIASAG